MSFPAQGTPNVWDPRNPTLVSDTSVPTAGAVTVDSPSPAAYLAANPRVDATAAVTIGGSITGSDTVALTVTCGTLPGGSRSWTYTVDGSDTVTTIAEGLLDLINSDSVAEAAQLYAEMGGTGHTAQIVFHWNGPVGNFAVLSGALNGGASETLTLAPLSGAFSGGSGPVFIANNFAWSAGGSLSNFWYGQYHLLSYDQMSAMVSQGQPIA